VHFLLDEAASLGPLDCLNDAVDKYRGYGVKLIFAYQSMGQLSDCWPGGKTQTLLSNTTQLFFGVNDQQTAEYVSTRSGDETIIVTSGGSGISISRQLPPVMSTKPYEQSVNISRSINDNWNQMAHRLMKPEQVLAAGRRTLFAFHAGLNPIKARTLRYYEEKWLYRKAKTKRQSRLPRLIKAAAFMCAGLACAWLVTLMELEWETSNGQRAAMAAKGIGAGGQGGGVDWQGTGWTLTIDTGKGDGVWPQGKSVRAQPHARPHTR
jgi:type IV secretion system protein VirD4